MFVQYHNLDIRVKLGDTDFRILNIARENLQRMIPNHSHGAESYELHYNAAGRGKVLIDGALHRLEPGSLYVVGPHVTHAQIPKPEDPQLDYCIYLQATPTQGAEKLGQVFLRHTSWIGQDTQQLGNLMEQLFAELENRRQGYTTLAKALLTQILVCVLRNYDTDAAPLTHFRQASLSEARSFIIEEAFLYEYATLTLEQLAEKLGLGTRQTQRMLLQDYGQTFREKRNEARMSAAVILLVYTSRSIRRIAEELGYATPEHFADAFRKYSGYAPLQYRKNHADRSEPPRELALQPPLGLKSARISPRE